MLCIYDHDINDLDAIMKTEIFVSALASLSLVASRPLGHRMTKREVPQEHSHNAILATVQTSLQTNNPAGIQDSVFGLLGNAVRSDQGFSMQRQS